MRATPASRVELNGTVVGETDPNGILVVRDLQPGRHLVAGARAGFAAASAVVELVEGRSEVVELELVPLPARLTVAADAAGAVLRVGGAAREHRLPVTDLELPPGVHRMTITGPGYVTVEEEIELRPGARTTWDVGLDPVPAGELLASARRQFDRSDYRAAAAGARAVVDVRPEAGAAHLLLGRALYALGRYDDSVVSLWRAILLGEQVVLETNHRHGGGGFRRGFCRGVITLSRTEIAFRSPDEPEHGFSLSAAAVTDVELTETVAGQPFRLNTRVRGDGTGRRNFDYLHRDAVRRREDPDSPLVTILTCPGCDASMAVQAALMAMLSREAFR